MFFRQIVAGLFFLFSFSAFAAAQGFDHSALDSFLKRHVDEHGRINYARALNDRADLDVYLQKVEETNLKGIHPEAEKTAFWLNVYHAGLIDLILQNYPIQSTKDVPGFWERRFLKVGLVSPKSEARYSLSQILSEARGGEKVHLAAATASVSGPIFPREVFTGPRVTGQLFKKTRAELGRPEMMTIHVAEQRVVLSQLFQWYAPDFVENFNRPERRAKLSKPDTAVINFLIRYCRNVDEQRLLKAGEFKIEYFPYDWSLNDRQV